MRRALAAATAATAVLAGAAIAGGQAAPITGADGPDRLAGGPGADTIIGERGSDRLAGGRGDDIIAGGPGYDTLLGGPGDDRLTDGSLGPDRIEGGPGDDVIRSAPRGMDRVRCGPGADRVEADASDIVGTDCETVVRTGRDEDAHIPVLSARGALMGHVATWRLSEDGGPLLLLWANAGHLYLRGPLRDGGTCFIAVTPSSGSRHECNDRRGMERRGIVRVRRAQGDRYKWFALTPSWSDALRVNGRRVPVWDGVAVFTAGRDPGAVFATGEGRSLRLSVP